MASNRKVMVLPGDGIGVEVMAANFGTISAAVLNACIQYGYKYGQTWRIVRFFQI